VLKERAESQRELTADESELLAAPADQFMLQLLGAESAATAAKFIADRANGLKLYAYRTRHKERPWNIVVVGPYADRNTALAAVAKLPPGLSSQKPWPRSLSSVQAEIRARR
jgi:DamX protein